MDLLTEGITSKPAIGLFQWCGGHLFCHHAERTRLPGCELFGRDRPTDGYNPFMVKNLGDTFNFRARYDLDIQRERPCRRKGGPGKG